MSKAAAAAARWVGERLHGVPASERKHPDGEKRLETIRLAQTDSARVKVRNQACSAAGGPSVKPGRTMEGMGTNLSPVSRTIQALQL